MAAVGGGVGREVSPRRPISQIQEAVGAPFALTNATHLVGLSRGKQKFLGSCKWQGQPCKFSWWFPHLGIAVDEIGADELDQRLDEFKHRRAWCDERFVIHTVIPRLDYRKPGISQVRQQMLDTLRKEAQDRRAELEE